MSNYLAAVFLIWSALGFIVVLSASVPAGPAYSIKKNKIVWVLEVPTPVDQTAERRQFQQELIEIDSAESSIQSTQPGEAVTEEQHTPFVREGRMMPTKENGKDYTLDPDGTIRLWDQNTQSYRPWS